jgi:hypothetical protein
MQARFQVSLLATEGSSEFTRPQNTPADNYASREQRIQLNKLNLQIETILSFQATGSQFRK